MLVYIVMREKGIRSDGYYDETRTTIIGVRDDPKKAAELLKTAVHKYHPDPEDKPIEGAWDQYGDTLLVYPLSDQYDRFWIEVMMDEVDDNLEGD